MRQEWEKARDAGVLVIAPPQVHKTGEIPEKWRVDMPAYVWGCFDLPHREGVVSREDVISRCPNGEMRTESTILRLSILRSPVGTGQDFTLESMVAQPGPAKPHPRGRFGNIRLGGQRGLSTPRSRRST